jgi:fumarylacetoacetate (FAA) hydrolase
MKLATLKAGGRDGRLIVVSRDLSRYLEAASVAPTLQKALDDWQICAPKLQALSDRLAQDGKVGLPFDASKCHSPLPRAYHWVDGSAYVNHVALVRKARGAPMPDSFWSDPLVYQGGSDDFSPPTSPIYALDEQHGIDLEGELAVITDDVPIGTSASQAHAHIKLLMLVNDVSLRGLIPAELAKGFGFYQSKPATSFAPVAITPDELGTAWAESKVHLPLQVQVNGMVLGTPNAGVDMTFSFAELIAHVTKTRALGAGAIVGSGTVSNRGAEGGPGLPVAQGGVGYACLAEVRTVETLLQGAPITPFLRFGDRVRLEVFDAQGQSVFGAIEQEVVRVA